MTDDDNKVYTADGASEYLGVSSRTIVRRIKRGDIEAQNIDGTWRIPAAEVQKLANLYAAKSSVKAPDTTPRRDQQISLKTAKPPRKVNEYTAAIVSASDAELAANRARLDDIARRAKSARYIAADGRAMTVKRGI